MNKKYRLKIAWISPSTGKVFGIGDELTYSPSARAYYTKGSSVAFEKEVVENNTDWFEEIPEEKIKEERIEVSDIKHQWCFPKTNIGIAASKEIPESKFPAIKKAVEDVLNEVNISKGQLIENAILLLTANNYVVEKPEGNTWVGWHGYKFTEQDVKDAMRAMVSCMYHPEDNRGVSSAFEDWLKQRK